MLVLRRSVPVPVDDGVAEGFLLRLRGRDEVGSNKAVKVVSTQAPIIKRTPAKAKAGSGSGREELSKPERSIERPANSGTEGPEHAVDDQSKLQRLDGIRCSLLYALVDG